MQDRLIDGLIRLEGASIAAQRPAGVGARRSPGARV